VVLRTGATLIQDLSQTLRTILTQPGLPSELLGAHVVFDRPADPFNPSQTTLDLFLYDLRENIELRSNVTGLSLASGQFNVTPPPLRLACTYLVTAWPVGAGELALQEQQLLSDVLQVLSRYPTIPSKFLQGTLAGQDPPLPMIALHPDALKNVWEFWTSVGTKLRASLSVTVTISIPAFSADAFPPLSQTIDVETGFEIQGRATTHVTSSHIGGTVTDGTNAIVSGATVQVVGLGLVATTDSEGRFKLGPLAPGTYTLRFTAGASTATKDVVVPNAVGKTYDVKLS
jgi:hypothetical protein